MDLGLLNILGGIGLFVIGMGRMTDALRTLASRRARHLMGRMAGSTLSAVLTGAGITALIQSSSAALVLTLGLVGAGMLTLTQAVGIALGANIGTTLTGWVVLFVGVKLKLGLLALPLLFAGALLGAVAHGRVAVVAQGIAGFALIFVGLELIERGVAGAEAGLLGGALPAAAGWGWVGLVALGALTTAIIQASSAGIAALLLLIGSGEIDVNQAIAVTIGLNIGSNMTPVLAAIGGSVEMQRTVLANVVFNVGTGLVAALAVVPITQGIAALPVATDPQATLVAFHTAFNVAGVVLMLPFVGALTQLVVRLIPDRTGQPLAARLDRRLQGDPGAALDSAAGVLSEASGLVWRAVAAELGRGDRTQSSRQRDEADAAAAALQDYLAGTSTDTADRATLDRFAALLHGVDHLHRLAHRASQTDRIAAIRAEPRLRRAVTVLRGSLVQVFDDPGQMPRAGRRLDRLEATLTAAENRLRHVTLTRPGTVTGLTPAHVLRLWEELRWLRRSTAHAAAMMAYLAAARNDRR